MSSSVQHAGRYGRITVTALASVYQARFVRVYCTLRVVRRLGVVLCLLAGAAIAPGQSVRVSFGAVGGVPLSNGAPGAYHQESPRYIVGPAAGLSIGEHFAVEFNALYRRLGASAVIPAAPPSADLSGYYFALRTRAHSWEFPVLGKYVFGSRNDASRFYLATGYSFQHSWTSSTFYVIQPETPDGQVGMVGVSVPGFRPGAVGAVFGGGLARKVGRMALAPAFRYTRWGYRADGAPRNQFDFLLGLWF